MTSTPLDSAIKLIQEAHNPPPPWSFVAPRLTSLLNLYSTGLTSSIACDEVGAAWREHKRLLPKASSPVHTATITRVLQGPPEVWLLRLEDGTFTSCFPPERLSGCFSIDTVVSFAEGDIKYGDKRSHVPAIETARIAFKQSGAARTDGTPVKRSQEKTSSKSPIDVMKFSERLTGVQFADTPSQIENPDDPGLSVNRVLLPSAPLFFNLDTVCSKALELDETPEAFSLQRVWNERSLTPKWIFAEVVELIRSPEYSVRLQDPVDNPYCDQPSVCWKLPKEFEMASQVLKPGLKVLLKSCAVQPMGMSFDVFCTTHTSCFYRMETKLDSPKIPTSTRRGGEMDRASKRQRIDPILSQALYGIGMRQVVSLAGPELQPKFSAYSVATAAATVQEKYLTVVALEFSISVRVVGEDMAKKATLIQAGDQILFDGLEWTAPSSSLGSQVPGGWVAPTMYNLSTMSGVLYSPFVRSVVALNSLRTATDRAQTRAASWVSHVCVGIRGVSLSEDSREVLLSIEDETVTKDTTTVQVLRPLDMNVSNATSREQQSAPHYVMKTVGSVVVRDRGLMQLFGQPCRKTFWDRDPVRALTQCRKRLLNESWLMTLKHSSSSQELELCACVPGSV